MTDQQQQAARPVKPWGGLYRFPRDVFEGPFGLDECRAGAEQRIRNSAREQGHEPEGLVTVGWYDHDPGSGPVPVLEGERDPDWKWCRAVVGVRLHAARAKEVGVFCPQCGQPPSVRGDSLVCLSCD